jgi:phospholipid/cholesterol/gamma-HCH transport system ATP-binding protein
LSQERIEIAVQDLTIGYGSYVVLSDLAFEVNHGDVFVIMGGSGSGKSTILRHLMGLDEPVRGDIRYRDLSLNRGTAEERRRIMRRFGVLFQSGALWSSMTLEENVTLPIVELGDVSREDARTLARLKLALVGLKGFEHLYPSELSGGMQKRAALARAIALDPELLFLDEPSAGLDPPTTRRIDELILELRESLGVTIVVVTHELSSIYRIGTNGIFIDAASRSIIARGNPRELRSGSRDARVHDFLGRQAGEAP